MFLVGASRITAIGNDDEIKIEAMRSESGGVDTNSGCAAIRDQRVDS
jgi:hypothetical protein